MATPVTAAILLAAGSGNRLGADRPKAFVELAGKAMLTWSLEALQAVPEVGRVVVTVPSERWSLQGVASVKGGETRSHSVRAVLELVGECQYVVVHDAARPLASTKLFSKVLGELVDRQCDGVIAAARVTDTVKQVDENGFVERTLDRSSLWAVQTPQAFRFATLVKALAVSDAALSAATDDAWLVEQAGGSVKVHEVVEDNFKVTTPYDLRLAERLLKPN